MTIVYGQYTKTGESRKEKNENKGGSRKIFNTTPKNPGKSLRNRPSRRNGKT